MTPTEGFVVFILPGYLIALGIILLKIHAALAAINKTLINNLAEKIEYVNHEESKP